LSHSAQIGANSVIGNATSIGEQCKISNSVIGEGCRIGKNVLIHGSYIWDNVIIEDGCKVSNSLVCDDVHLRAGAIVEPGCILSFKVCCHILYSLRLKKDFTNFSKFGCIYILSNLDISHLDSFKFRQIYGILFGAEGVFRLYVIYFSFRNRLIQF
jgi:UDP-3-O-[3-hydroxymyristoyl] glucosamine N-acyltransferase